MQNVFQMRVCDTCGKDICITCKENYTYKKTVRSVTKYYCCYTCFMKEKKEKEDKRKNNKGKTTEYRGKAKQIQEVKLTIVKLPYLQELKTSLENQLQEQEYKETSSLSQAPARGNGFNSKVENYAINNLEKTDKLREVNKQLAVIEKYLSSEALDETERRVLECVANNYSLKDFAKRNNLYISYIYKIRDRACYKIYTTYCNM